MPQFEGKQAKRFQGSFSELYVAINETPDRPNTVTSESSGAIWLQSDRGLNAAFSVSDAKAIVEHINSLIAEIENRTPKPSKVIEAFPVGTRFEVRFNAEDNDPGEYVRTYKGISGKYEEHASLEALVFWDEHNFIITKIEEDN